MKKITPYKTMAGALKALDNGGRLYNVFTKANDGTITNSELLKAAGIFSGRDQAFLYFHMALAPLAEAEQARVVSRLEPELRQAYAAAVPRAISVDAFEQEGESKQTVMVQGYPRFLEDQTHFSAFIMVPISAGSVTTFTMVPIFNQFDVYELFAEADCTGPSIIVAATSGRQRLPMERTTFGGVIKELSFETEAAASHAYYLETLYYITE